MNAVLYFRIKFRSFGITWATEVWRVTVDGWRFDRVDFVPPETEKRFDRWGVSIHA